MLFSVCYYVVKFYVCCIWELGCFCAEMLFVEFFVCVLVLCRLLCVYLCVYV
jgi:hypothetical protein